MAQNNQVVTGSITAIAAISEENMASTQEVSAIIQEQSASYQEVDTLATGLAQIAESLKQSVAAFKLTKINS